MIKDLMALSWEDLSNVDPEKLVVFVGVAPIEEHGRHLPIGVDVYETNHWIKEAVKRLDEILPDYCFGLLPIIPLGFADMGQFPGNIHVSKMLIHQVVYEAVKAIANWGTKNIIVISAHADPLHTVAVEQACEKVNQEKGETALAPMGSIFNLEEKGISSEQIPELAEMQKRFPNDFHAGWIETSCMLEILPDVVKGDYANRPDISLQGRDIMDRKKVVSAISGEGHIGFPKEASTALGTALNADMAEKIKTAAYHFILRNDYEQYRAHPLSVFLTRALFGSSSDTENHTNSEI